jgi:hypothetical protein
MVRELLEKLKWLLLLPLWPVRKYQERQRLKRRMKELKDRDPFIYR